MGDAGTTGWPSGSLLGACTDEVGFVKGDSLTWAIACLFSLQVNPLKGQEIGNSPIEQETGGRSLADCSSGTARNGSSPFFSPLGGAEWRAGFSAPSRQGHSGGKCVPGQRAC